MLTLPQIVERPAVAYIAIKAHVSLPFDDKIADILDRLFGFLKDNDLREAGPVFFKHNFVAMPHIEMEFGVPVDRTIPVEGDFVSGYLPAGRYGEVSYFGPYDDLITVNGMLIGWARHVGWTFDARQETHGEWFSNRLEIYHNSPAEEPDPQKLHTTVSIKLKD